MKTHEAYQYISIAFNMADSSFHVNEDIWYMTLSLCIIYLLAICFMFKKNNKYVSIFLCICIVYINFERYIIFTNQTQVSEQVNYCQGDAGHNLLDMIRDDLSQDGKIYVIDNRDKTDHQIFYMYQFLNYSLHIIPRLPDTYDEDMLLFTNKKIDSIFLDNCLISQLDDNEYVYCRGKKYIELLEKNGVNWDD